MLDAYGDVRAWTQGRREVVIRGAPGGGVTRDTTGTDEARRLPAEVLVELAHLGASVTDHFGQPQDVEWAYAEGRVWLLQTRPMTALAPPPVRLTRVQRSGDVLVCPYTNPSWTSLFQRAAAVVVDTGGPTSHAAIVAREYGIPAVMGTGTATTSLADAQMVTVDGDRGRVTAAAGTTKSVTGPPARRR